MQFKLKTVFALLTCIAIFCGWLALRKTPREYSILLQVVQPVTVAAPIDNKSFEDEFYRSLTNKMQASDQISQRKLAVSEEAIRDLVRTNVIANGPNNSLFFISIWANSSHNEKSLKSVVQTAIVVLREMRDSGSRPELIKFLNAPKL